MAKILVAGPYCGELGWEMFSWQPRVRARATMGNGYDKVLVYTGPGREWLYRFAETRTLPDMLQHEPECLAWSNMAAHKADMDDLMHRVHATAKLELGTDQFEFLSYHNMGNMADPAYAQGRPDLLYPDDSPRQSRFWQGSGLPKIVLCVRDRKLADHRNWSYDNWYRLAELLQPEHDVVVVGKIERPDGWHVPDGVTDATGQTTIDDLIELFSQANLAVGGSTGTMHLASRCGCDHVAWGAENATKFPLTQRYAETNWFGARHYVITEDAWSPTPEKISTWAKSLAHKWSGDIKPKVMVTFDDGTIDHLAASGLLDRLGLKGTFGIVTNLVGTPGFLTWEDLVGMKAMGHCICAHSSGHSQIALDPGRPHVRVVGPDGIVCEAIMAKEQLNSRGLDGDYYMAPFGTGNVNADVVKRLQQGFKWIRLTVGAPMGDTWIPVGHRRHLPGDWSGKICGIASAADTRWPDDIRDKIDECAMAGTLCVLAYHQTTDVVGQTMAVTWKRFEKDMNHLAWLVKNKVVECVMPKDIVG